MTESRHIHELEDTAVDKRNDSEPQPILLLLELNPIAVVEGVRLEDDGYRTDDINTYGAMRETCPGCDSAHLQLVLKQTNVRRAHVFCPQCTRCFDALYEDGTSALTL